VLSTFKVNKNQMRLNKGVYSGGLRGLAPFLECGTALHTSVDCESAVPLSLKFARTNVHFPQGEAPLNPS
jgi:hypothetical protein